MPIPFLAQKDILLFEQSVVAPPKRALVLIIRYGRSSREPSIIRAFSPAFVPKKDTRRCPFLAQKTRFELVPPLLMLLP